MDITTFANTDFINYVAYDNYRSIASMVDGLKVSGRKVLYTLIDDNVSSPIKVSTCMSDAAKKTVYIHGEQSLYSVIVSLAQEFVGTNNIPLLTRAGTFGNRCIPDAAAPRYIKTCKEKYLDDLFDPLDFENLIEQQFEGEKIEPKFFVPILPMLVINGSIGLSTGFAQKILPHNPTEVIKYIERKLNDKPTSDCNLKPYFVGYTGEIKQSSDDPKCFFMCGVLKKITNLKYEITEIPPNFNLTSYIKVLDQLVEEKKIKKYVDQSNDNTFHFIIHLYEAGAQTNVDSLIKDLKLIKPITENYTSTNQENKIEEFESIEQILNSFIDIRLQYYQKRKDSMLKNMMEDLQILYSKYIFIKSVIDGVITINNKKVAEIEQQIQQNDKIIKVKDSYQYLLNMPLHSITQERYTKLGEDIKELGEKYKKTAILNPKDMWLSDLSKLKKVLPQLH